MRRTFTASTRVSMNASWGKSRCSCKPGAPLPPSPTLKNVLVVGDSISIGYTPFIAAALADIAQVQHAPFSGDGGSEEASYTLQCLLTYWLSSPSGLPVHWDLIYINTGMHNSGQGAEWIVPGQSGEVAAYTSELASIATALSARAAADGTKLLFAITSPMLCNSTIDAVITSTLNPAARAIMAALSIPTIDLHKAITDACGPVPQASCFGNAGEFCPHADAYGYGWLANNTIGPAIRAALA